MEPHQQRVVDEKIQLDERLTKLYAFIANSAVFRTLTPTEQHRLSQQSAYMQGYLNVLNERIKAFV